MLYRDGNHLAPLPLRRRFGWGSVMRPFVPLGGPLRRAIVRAAVDGGLLIHLAHGVQNAEKEGTYGHE